MLNLLDAVKSLILPYFVCNLCWFLCNVENKIIKMYCLVLLYLFYLGKPFQQRKLHKNVIVKFS